MSMQHDKSTSMNNLRDESRSMNIQWEESKSKDSIYKTLSLKNCETEREISVFYGNVLKLLFENSGGDWRPIQTYLKKLRSYKTLVYRQKESVPYDREYIRLAYIFAYGPIHSIIMYDHFSNMLKLNEKMLKKIATVKTIKLCFLGGGPALEAASMIKLLNDTVTTFSIAEREALELHVTVIDKYPGWEENSNFIINAAQKNLCDSTKIQIYFRFVKADLTTDISEDLRKIIKKAHIVVMFKFLSDVNMHSNFAEQETTDMIQMILNCMSFKSCLFYLDSSGGFLFSILDRFIDEQESTLRIYGPYTNSCHSLSQDSVDKLSDIFGYVFRYLRCTSQCTISCSAWFKVRNISKVDGLYYTSVVEPIEVDDLQELKLKKKKKGIKKGCAVLCDFPRDIWKS